MHGVWMHICSRAHPHVFECTRRPEVVIKCFSITLHLFETRFLPTSLSEPCLWDWLASTSSGSPIPVLDFQLQGYSHALPGMAFTWVLRIQIQGVTGSQGSCLSVWNSGCGDLFWLMFSEVSVHGFASHGPIVELESQGSRSPCAAERQKTQEGPGPQTSFEDLPSIA